MREIELSAKFVKQLIDTLEPGMGYPPSQVLSAASLVFVELNIF